MKILCTFFLFFFLFIATCFSQSENVSVFHIHSLSAHKGVLLDGVFLDRGWKFHTGDHTEWADPDYDDKAWESIDPTSDIHSLPQISRHGIICWFRLHLSIDSNLQKDQLALIIEQSGASEIYLNGRPIKRFGQLSTNAAEIKAYDPSGKPILFPISKNTQQVLAVRYALQPGIFYTTTTGRQNPALLIRVSNLETSIDQYQRASTDYTASIIFRVGVFLILAILHFAFYIFYPSKNANLYFCLYAVLILIGEIATTSFRHEVRNIFYASNFTQCCYQIANFLILTAIYSLFTHKKRFVYLILLVLTITGIFINIWFYYWGFMVSVFIIYTLINIEIVHISFISVKNEKRGALIIGTGSLCFLVFWLAFILGIRLNYLYFHIGSTYTIGDLLYNLTALSIPVATSIYLGLDFAFTSRELKNKLSDVQKLSAEKQQILTSQKEMLEQQVQQRTAALNQSLEDLKSTQAQLIQSEKMASLGELTAGIAHEIQNPLNFVNNFSEVNKEMIDEATEEINKGNINEVKNILIDIKDNEEKINHHGKRADAIVKGMLQHTRKSTGQKEPTDINVLCDEYLRLSYHGMRAKDKDFNVTLQTDFDSTIGKINVVPQDIGRVLLNLYNNAFYVASQMLTAQGSQLKAEDSAYVPTVAVVTKKLTDKIEIRVSDNGPGIPQNIVDKIFQPFFTTKPTGEGTGLGLSLSYDIIKAHGGEIRVETKANEGSEFIITLPL